jgi:hypothetical protein
MSKYDIQYEEDVAKVERRKEVASKIMAYWKSDLSKALSLREDNAVKVEYLKNTGVAKKIMALYEVSDKVLTEMLKKYISNPSDTEWDLKRDEWIYNRIINLSESDTIKKELSSYRSNLTSVLPKKVLDYLPKKMVIDLDPDGQIVDIYSRYANKDKNLGVKIYKQREFMKVKDNFEQLLNKGMLSRDNSIKMMSLIIAVMYDTGIRPGDDEPGLSYANIETEGPETQDKKKPKPIRELVDTFGSISLEPQHFRVLDGITNLGFYGKSGVFNKAQISNQLLNRVIKEVIIRFALEGQEKPLFSVDGVGYNAKQLQTFYVGLLRASGMQDITGHSMTDLRKLKSSTVLHEYLVSNKKELEDKILAIENVFSKKAYKQITDVIVSHIDSAVKKSEVALNHTSMNMTINSYINPQVILNFLSTSGEIENSFGDLLVSGGKITFDVQGFVIKASQSRFADNGGWMSVIESGERLGLPEMDEFAKGYSILRSASSNKKRLVVDRIEGKRVICRVGRSMLELPLGFLPKGVKEGMAVDVSMVLQAIPTGILKKKIKQLSVGDAGGDFSI